MLFLLVALTQQKPTGESWIEIAIWSGALIGLVGVGLIAVTILRRFLHQNDDNEGDNFTLHGLRQLLARGEITEIEFEKAKQAIITRVKSDNVEEEPSTSEMIPDEDVSYKGRAPDQPEGTDSQRDDTG